MGRYKNLKKALLVEDDPDLRELCGSMVRVLGLDVLQAANGKEAVAILRHEKVDILITDFRMPVMNGIELLAWCRENKVHIPVVFASGEAQLLEGEQIALSDCCATLMRKPIEPQALRAAIDAADARSHHRDCVHSKKAGK